MSEFHNYFTGLKILKNLHMTLLLCMEINYWSKQWFKLMKENKSLIICSKNWHSPWIYFESDHSNKICPKVEKMVAGKRCKVLERKNIYIYYLILFYIKLKVKETFYCMFFFFFSFPESYIIIDTAYLIHFSLWALQD